MDIEQTIIARVGIIDSNIWYRRSMPQLSYDREIYR